MYNYWLFRYLFKYIIGFFLRFFLRSTKSSTISGHDDNRYSARIRHGRCVRTVHEVNSKLFG